MKARARLLRYTISLISQRKAIYVMHMIERERVCNSRYNMSVLINFDATIPIQCQGKE